MIGTCGNFVHSKTFWLLCGHCGASEAAHIADSTKPKESVVMPLEDVIQAAIYKARWVDNFGKESKIATDKELTKAVIEAIAESGALPTDSTLSRVEVIDNSGRAFVKYTSTGAVTTMRQDGGRTLKIFIQEETP